MSVINVKEYENHLIESEKSKRTIRSYTNTLMQLNEFFKNNGIEEITKSNLIEFKTFLQNKYDNIKTINGKIVQINIFLKWAKKNGLLRHLDIVDYGGVVKEVNLDNLKLKHLKQQSNAHRPSPNESEYKRLVKYAVNEEIKMFILTIGNTGLRISEIVKYLRFSDLDKKNIKIKNKGKTRIIAIPMWLRKDLKKSSLLENEKDTGKDGYLFPKSQQWYRTKIKETASKAHISKEKVYPHCFRHYFAKSFLKNGGDSLVLQQLLGHESSKTTELYVKMDEEDLTNVFKGIKNR
ncbi:tyrosine-type recombinase/integrase [Erysipelotrichaceae bacterium OttesenSCG-928-M19]|nr:tyrosine-type recombinase/integrase [Erysipelotrichaceae bacterium OttesenSCG-928-M19]